MVKRTATIAVFLMALSLTAIADNMTLTGTGSNTAAGVYVVPYYLTVQSGSSSTTYTVACDSYFNDVSLGESWTGTINTWATLDQTAFGSVGSFDAATAYTEAAWLYDQYLADPSPSNAAATNFAIWSLFLPAYQQSLDPSEYANFLSGFNAAAQAMAGAAVSWYASATGAQLSAIQSSLLIFTPNPATSTSNGIGPQEYITTDPVLVPEPASLLVFGTGLLLGFGCLQRKLSLS